MDRETAPGTVTSCVRTNSARVVELRFGKRFARKGQLDNRHGRRVVSEDERRGRARRHLWNWLCEMPVICAFAASTLAPGCRKTLDDGAAVHRDRFDVLDVVDRGGEAAFDVVVMRPSISSALRPV